MVKKYKFPCGCEFDIVSDKPLRIKIIKEIGTQPNQIRLDCPATWDFLSTGNTKGIFQLSSHLGSSLSAKLRPSNMHELAGLISISRPGCLEAILEDGKSATNHYIDRKNRLEPVEYFHPSLEPILKRTYGLLVYQEQAMVIAQRLAGFSLEEADNLRKAIGKKKVDLMAKVKKDFISGCKEKGVVGDEDAAQIWDWIEKSQRYSFNASHAYSYAFNTYIAAFDKSHTAKLFFVSNCVFSKKEQKPLEELNELVWNARSMGIDIYGPDIRIKNIDFKIHKGKIHYGLVNVKGIGKSHIEALLRNIEEVEEKIDKKIENWCWYEVLFYLNVSSTVFKNLIDSGALDFLNLDRRFMVFEYEVFTEINDRERDFILQSGDICRFTSISDAINVLITAPVGRQGGVSNKNRFKKVEGILHLSNHPPKSIKDNASSIARSEKTLLGVEISSTVLDDKDTSSANSTCRDIIADANKFQRSYLVAVCVDKVKEIKTKKGQNAGSLMAFVDMYDITGKTSCTVFSDVYSEYKGMLVPGNTLLVSVDGGSKGNILKKAHQI